jgi:hypothetical protein
LLAIESDAARGLVEFIDQHAVNKLTPGEADEAGKGQIVFEESHDELC